MRDKMELLPYKCDNCSNVFKADPSKLTVKNGRYTVYCPYCSNKQEKL